MATRALRGTRPPPRRAGTRLRATPHGAVVRRRLAAAVVVAIALYAVYMLWFRDLSWFSVDDVSVEGATTSERQITAAIANAAEDMTTLHLKDDELTAAVSRFPTVAALKAETSFPHELHVTVRERLPVAVATIRGRQVAVSPDGYMLMGLSFDSKELPTIEGASAAGARLDEKAAAQAAILGATPEPLRERLEGTSWEEEDGGVVVEMEGAPALLFGDGFGAEDKWAAAVAVLSSEERGSPSYLDVSVPERPVSGG
ncbi:MAG TPA: FtsQ-type POTRA domain-containing protein [Solirubrobacterales bacterium]